MIVIFDGDCDVCHFSIRWIQKYAIPGRFEYIPCQSQERQQRFPQIIESDCMQAIHLVRSDSSILKGAKALPVIMTGLHRWRWLAWVLKLPLIRHLSPVVYRTIANNRQFISHQLFKGTRFNVKTGNKINLDSGTKN